VTWLLKIFGFISGGGLSSITQEIAAWDIKRREAVNDRDRVRAETMLSQLRMQQELLVAEQKHASTRWVRPAFALVALIYWAKLVVWDTILELGATPYPGDHVAWFVTLIPTAYFLTRPFEKARG